MDSDLKGPGFEVFLFFEGKHLGGVSTRMANKGLVFFIKSRCHADTGTSAVAFRNLYRGSFVLSSQAKINLRVDALRVSLKQQKVQNTKNITTTKSSSKHG